MPRKMERFTNSARRVFELSQEAASEFNTTRIEPVHLLLAMTRARDTDAYLALDDFDIVETKLLPFVKLKKPPQESIPEEIELSDKAKRVLELSLDYAINHSDFWMGTAHLLIGLLQHQEDELIANILDHFTVERDQLSTRTKEYLEDSNSLEQQLQVQEEVKAIRKRQYLKKPTMLESVRRMLGFSGKRKNDEK